MLNKYTLYKQQAQLNKPVLKPVQLQVCRCNPQVCCLKQYLSAGRYSRRQTMLNKYNLYKQQARMNKPVSTLPVLQVFRCNQQVSCSGQSLSAGR
jgi:hypothetical protein